MSFGYDVPISQERLFVPCRAADFTPHSGCTEDGTCGFLVKLDFVLAALHATRSWSEHELFPLGLINEGVIVPLAADKASTRKTGRPGILRPGPPPRVYLWMEEVLQLSALQVLLELLTCPHISLGAVRLRDC